MGIKMRMLPGQFQELQKILAHDTTREQGCFLLCSQASTKTDDILLINGIIPLAPDDFREQRYDLLSVDPGAMLRAARQAQKGNKSVCFVHTHPMSVGAVDFSRADDIGNVRTFEFFNRMLPDKINSALVFSGNMNAVTGRVYHSSRQWSEIDSLEVIGQPYLYPPPSKHSDGIRQEVFHRQALLLGEAGQDILKGMSVAVVGLGGIGSLIAMMLGHSGFGRLIMIDPDHYEASNHPRIIGATPSDVLAKTPKVEIARRYLAKSWPECAVQAHKVSAEDPVVKDELINADLIICGTDNAHSRGYFNEICHRYYVPLLDLGVEFSAPDGILRNEVGKANLVMPGTPCLWCTGHVSAELIAAEELPEDEQHKRAAEGYIRDLHVPQPSMMPFNAEVAARGVQLIVQQFTGLSEVTPSTYEQFSFFGLNGRGHHQLVRKKKNSNCLFCSTAGGLVGAGDSSQMLIKKAS